jgi:hypothetical protein
VISQRTLRKHRCQYLNPCVASVFLTLALSFFIPFYLQSVSDS